MTLQLSLIISILLPTDIETGKEYNSVDMNWHSKLQFGFTSFKAAVGAGVRPRS
jgi:hypothetical protein